MVRTGDTRHGEARTPPWRSRADSGAVRLSPGFRGWLCRMRVEVLGRGSAGARHLWQVARGFQSPFQIRQLAVDAAGICGQEHGDAVASPLRHLRGRDAVVEPLRQASVPIVVHAPSGGDSKTCGDSAALRAAPRPSDDGTGEDAAGLTPEEQITRLELLVLDVLPKDAGQGRAPSSTAGPSWRGSTADGTGAGGSGWLRESVS